MEKVKIKVLLETGVDLPIYMTEGSAGMDVKAFIKENIKIKPMERVLVPTGIRMEIPQGYEVQVRPRSGLAIKHGLTLLNSPGTIDSDYRGEIKIIIINLSNEEYEIKPDERIGQFIIGKVYHANFEKVQKLCESQRDSGGFGHTGK